MNTNKLLAVLAVLLLGCPGDDSGDDDDDGADDGGTAADDGVGSTTGGAMDDGDGGSTAADDDGGSTAADDGDDGDDGDGTDSGSGSDDGGSDSGGEVAQCYEPTLDLSLCDPATATFSLDSTNQYYPLIVGSRVVLEGMDEDELVRIEREVLDTTEMVAGVETHVLEHREYVDNELVEVALDYYVEASDGTVCYFGEDVENYEGGVVVNDNGTWHAGENGAVPGIIMAADPMSGMRYFQEYAPGEALDQGEVDSIEDRTVGEMDLTDVLLVYDTNPLEDCEDVEPKLYAPGIGEVADVDVVLIEYEPGG